MNKKKWIAAAADKSGMARNEVAAVADALLETIANAMVRGEKVSLVGFGTFEVRDRAARSGKNPRTGETMNMEACKIPAFRAGKALKESVNGR